MSKRETAAETTVLAALAAAEGVAEQAGAGSYLLRLFCAHSAETVQQHREQRMDGIPTPDEARDWLKEHGQAPDLTMTWHVTEQAGTADRHLRLLHMLFSPRPGDQAA